MNERVMIVTDRRGMGGDPLAAVGRALSGVRPGTVIVQVREKDLGGRELCELAIGVVGVAHAAGARVVINERVDVAMAVGADGVHLPEGGMEVGDVRRIAPEMIVGTSVHDRAGVGRRAGADYLVAGAVWDAPGKPGMGIEAFAELVREAKVPVLAIGGIDVARADAALAAGAHGVAAIRSVWAARDPAAETAALVDVALNR